jgi:hypothetical protein
MSKGALVAADASTLYTIGTYLLLIIERRPGTDGVTCIEERCMFGMQDGVQCTSPVAD